MSLSPETLGAAMSFVNETMQGAGALKGEEGKSAYEVAIANGFDGSEEEWLESLKATGDNNVIESISVDGNTVSPDGNKNVNLNLSDYVKKDELEGLATEEYVDDKILTVKDGEDGFSPIAKVEQTPDGAVITITDSEGTTTATIKNGKDGAVGSGEGVNVNLTDYAKLSDIPTLNEWVPDIASDIADDSKYYVEHYHDIHVIPDRYNTGCDESLLTPAVASEAYPNGLVFRNDGGSLDFNKSPLKTLDGEYIVENLDFTGLAGNEKLYAGHMNAGSYAGNGIKLIYKNCKFKYFRQSYDHEHISSEFYNCTFEHLVIANAKIYKCFFGDLTSTDDPTGCRSNCTFVDCYWSNMQYPTDEQGQGHLDGVQTIDSKNVSFINCRWEVPAINFTTSNALMNDAVYIQTQNGGTENILVDHCVINGGEWYSVAADPTNKTIKIIEPKMGYCHEGSTPWYGGLDPYIQSGVVVNPTHNDSLFVSSVWKDGDKLKFMVTNDTNKERILRVVTDSTETEFTIPRTYKKSEYEADIKTYWDFPYDVELNIEVTNPKYVVFFENGNQIRFVNYSGNRVEKPASTTSGSGEPGANGFSPIAKVEQTADGAVITITDSEGTTTATIKNGKDGEGGSGGLGIVEVPEATYLQMVANGTVDKNTIYNTEKSLLDGNEVRY